MTLRKVMQFIGDLIRNSFTGRIILDFHKGDISKRIRKETMEIIE